MGITVKESGGGGSFKSVEPGTYQAICYRIIDLGTHHGEYLGEPTVRRQVLICWELPTEKIEGGDYDGQPYTVSKFYTLSLHEKAGLRKDLEAWRGRAFTEAELKGFDLDNILGKPCMVSVVAGANGKSKVGSVMALPKGMPVGKLYNPTLSFSIDTWDDKVFQQIPDGIKEIIQRSDEAKSFGGNTGPSDMAPPHTDDDALPF